MVFKQKLNHDQYQNFVKIHFKQLFMRKEIRSILRFAPFIARFFLLNLDPLRELLIPTYNHPRRMPWDPVCLFRALILMVIKKEPSITNWVDRLKNNKVYAILSGFDPDDVPGVGTFYDFIDRLTLADKQLRRKRKNQRKRVKRKPAQKLKKKAKRPPKQPESGEKRITKRMKMLNNWSFLGQYRSLDQFFIPLIHCFEFYSRIRGA